MGVAFERIGANILAFQRIRMCNQVVKVVAKEEGITKGTNEFRKLKCDLQNTMITVEQKVELAQY